MSDLPDAVERWICAVCKYESQRRVARMHIEHLLHNTNPESPVRIAIKAAMAVRDPDADLGDLEALDNALRNLGEDV